MVRFKRDYLGVGGFAHPPEAFAIGPDRGYLWYPGQPVYCRRCGSFGHIKEVYTSKKCRNCLAGDHETKDCVAPKTCNLCGSSDHLFRGCPDRQRSFASLFQADFADLGGVVRRTGVKAPPGGTAVANTLEAPDPEPVHDSAETREGDSGSTGAADPAPGGAGQLGLEGQGLFPETGEPAPAAEGAVALTTADMEGISEWGNCYDPFSEEAQEGYKKKSWKRVAEEEGGQLKMPKPGEELVMRGDVFLLQEVHLRDDEDAAAFTLHPGREGFTWRNSRGAVGCLAEFRKAISDFYAGVRGLRLLYCSAVEWWEAAKCRFRVFCQRYGALVRRRERAEVRKWMGSLLYLHGQLNAGMVVDWAIYEGVKGKIRGLMEEMMAAAEAYYADLFRTRDCDPETQKILMDMVKARLGEGEAQALDAPLSLAEVTEAMCSLKDGLGEDGVRYQAVVWFMRQCPSLVGRDILMHHRVWYAALVSRQEAPPSAVPAGVDWKKLSGGEPGIVWDVLGYGKWALWEDRMAVVGMQVRVLTATQLYHRFCGRVAERVRMDRKV
ncbi:hypothetical protein SKAU_G00387340 [Synaphobranchus kaupii]|uniref:CCHC-type domain-containing protein n=1 Tax=Synaphobranchus kaupii TaxID=118154 RepID=A0A9Q1EAX6_SYNKA|nr:hypothetical protein SKAU_G00387340 [Synaphobranchus kaupii]